ncbi:AAA family ATPase [candidate division KSB1 bacterium]|nr:AAA family ATPase [candidate division KSB1 bacterium]
MRFPFYSGDPQKRQMKPIELPPFKRAGHEDPSRYLPDSGLVDAVNVALLLGQPLLLTGEPGTGKTQLAFSVAWELGFKPPLKFETKSTSTARDLFYTYDTLSRFHAAQTGEGSQNSLDYLTYNALGLAILLANDKSVVASWLPPDFHHDGPRRSVVLIDEVDKAPRDFPNDILNEVEGMYFKIPELGNVKIEAQQELRPILIITSNSEKHLPDAFLRRCIYYNIPFPDQDRLKKIIDARLGLFTGGSSQLLDDALDLFHLLRRPESGLQKRPATAELLGWLLVLREIGEKNGLENPLRQQPERIAGTLNSLVKTIEDQQRSKAVLKEWMDRAR